jgi:hypothetical protein
MTTIFTPTKQTIYNSRSSQKSAEFSNSNNAKMYLSRHLNNLLRSLVNSNEQYSSKIIGCNPFFVNYIDNQFILVITKGQLIIDSTLIEIEEAPIMDIALDIAFDEVIVIAEYNYIESSTIESTKFKYRLILRNSKTNKTNIDLNNNLILILSRFKIIRDEKTKKVKRILHPYGEWKQQLYSEFLKNINVSTIVGVDFKVYRLLETDMSLCDKFYMNERQVSIDTPLFFDTNSVNQFYSNKIKHKYRIGSLDGFYYSKMDINYRIRMDIFDTTYSGVAF